MSYTRISNGGLTVQREYKNAVGQLEKSYATLSIYTRSTLQVF